MKNLAFLLLLTVISCAREPKKESIPFDPFAQLTDENVKNILKRAIEKAGGYEAWSKIHHIAYTKRSVLFLEDSSVESEVEQRHEYRMQPSFEAKITWQDGEDEHRIEYNDAGATKFINDSAIDSDPSETVMSALYVLGMPFKLLDEGAILDYKGITIIDEKYEADVISATYDPEANDNHSTQDAWYYYFDKNDGAFLGAMVYHAPTYAYIRNLDFVESIPVKLHAHRKSYRCDSARNIQFLRAEFWYSDYQVN